MIPNFAFVVEERLAGCAHPGWGEMLCTALDEMVIDYGVTAIVTLTRDPLDEADLEKFHLKSYHMPVTDFGVPGFEEMQRAVDWIRGELDDGGRVVVHCAGGYGRTGTLLACFLVADGMDAEQAIRQVRARRPGSIETPAQEDFVRQWQGRLVGGDGHDAPAGPQGDGSS